MKRGRSAVLGKKGFQPTHGMYGTSEYIAWKNLRSRCYNPKNIMYKHYGDRGITVCARWVKSFENFYADMGDKPSPDHSIDRIDNDGNYEPSNCRWATKREQLFNQRRTKRYLIDGIEATITEHCERVGLSRSIAIQRIGSGWAAEDLLLPPHTKKPNCVELRGEASPLSKLKEKEVLEIRQLRGKEVARVVGEQFGVSKATVQAIWQRRLWKWLA